MTNIEAINIANRFFAIADKIIHEAKLQYVIRVVYSVMTGGSQEPRIGLTFEHVDADKRQTFIIDLDAILKTHEPEATFKSEVGCKLFKLRAAIDADREQRGYDA